MDYLDETRSRPLPSLLIPRRTRVSGRVEYDLLSNVPVRVIETDETYQSRRDLERPDKGDTGAETGGFV